MLAEQRWLRGRAARASAGERSTAATRANSCRDPVGPLDAPPTAKGRLDDCVARKVWRDRLKVGDFSGWAAAGHSGSSSSGQAAVFSTAERARLHVVGDPFVDN